MRLALADLIDPRLRLLVDESRVFYENRAESESLLLTWASSYGGALRKFQIYRAESLGSFTTWRPQLPVTQWSVVKMHKD